ncbi:MAG: anthranilate phosphoribosyltransferase [Alphaproteobacteria bacterium]|nr:anthranilate phosphoribosyltransferase [Alphaproteobacteria bacterium]|tara:strand:- start:510 stop:1535 length:1026 start_codon:yes stop_codon:yes gene_type:complete
MNEQDFDTKALLSGLREGNTLREEQMRELVSYLVSGDASDTFISAVLSLIAVREITPEEIAGGAKALRDVSKTINAPDNAVDCCGTGGDGLHSYNISTAVALITSACGVPMAKHGNRASSSKCGAADVLEELGVNLNAPVNVLEKALQNIGFAFLMAPNHHAALAHVGKVRKELGFRTFFNIMGPLISPAQAKRQLIGVYSKELLKPMGEALKKLGSQKTWLVCGEDGLDEISLNAPTHCLKIDDTETESCILSNEDFGLPSISLEDIRGGDATYNAQALQKLLNGADNAYRYMALANAAAVLVIADKAPDLKNGVAMAAHAIDNGSAKNVLKAYIQITGA